MDKYINTDVLKHQLQLEADCGHVTTLEDVLQIIDFVPTADVVEVVRCKECRYFLQYSEKYAQEVEHADGDCFIKILHCEEKQYYACKYDDYCSFGERRDSND